MNLNKKKKFCCPINEDLYFIPKCDCLVDTPRFPSATGCLSREETEELEECIEEANELLLSLGLSGERGKVQSTYLALQDKLGADIQIELECTVQNELTGNIILVGRDFLIVDHDHGKAIIPYEHIVSFSIDEGKLNYDFCRQVDEWIKDPYLRRGLVLNFGAVVSQSPALIQEFFGLTLPVLLITYSNCEVKVYMDNELISGSLVDVDSDTIRVQSQKSYEMIPLANICKIEVGS